MVLRFRYNNLEGKSKSVLCTNHCVTVHKSFMYVHACGIMRGMHANVLVQIRVWARPPVPNGRPPTPAVLLPNQQHMGRPDLCMFVHSYVNT